MRRRINNVISVLTSMVRLLGLKLIHRGALQYEFIERISPSAVIELEKTGQMILGHKASIHSGCKIKVRKDASLVFGDDVFLNYGCMIMCRDRISIGDGCEFGPNVLVYDHDHDVSAEGGLKAGKYNTAPVTIGKNCWIGANSVILKGVTIGDQAVIGAGSVITRDVPPRTKVIQKRESTLYKL